ncbi:hypothetical protein DHW03_05985 [Pedobacter yonginense]|uniref:Uncharacterized protein n=1 Tax=Pedobacter yonginense TaxID=651869 RepID=A0A317ERP8_9SPHI|nr:hypothetical protein [Pedobacter yonginense]PWS29364.1 hypothetical protein DHW03_05985 [Pedobacter yonginense]
MQAFDQIQELWQKHEVEVKFSADEMLQQAKKEVSGLKIKSALNIVGMLASFIAIAGVWLFYEYESWTSHAGFVIFLVSILSSTIILYRDYKLISRNDFTVHPKEFLAGLKTYQVNRYRLYNQMYWFYTTALSLGFIFTFIEILPRLTLFQQIFAVALTFLWILFCSTLLRTAVMKREKERIALLIEKFERITDQISTGA